MIGYKLIRVSDGHRDRDGHRGRDDRRGRDGRHGSGRGLYRGHDPTDDHVQTGRDRLPSIPQNTAHPRDAGLSIEHLHRVAGSNTHRATCNDDRPGTSSRRSTQIQDQDAGVSVE